MTKTGVHRKGVVPQLMLPDGLLFMGDVYYISIGVFMSYFIIMSLNYTLCTNCKIYNSNFFDFFVLQYT